MKPLFFFFIIFLLIPLATAFDCSTIERQDECNMLNDENEDLIANLIYTDTYIPNHNFVLDYNKNINVNDAPYDTTKQSNGMIKDAWVSLIYLSPSVIYNNSLYVPDNFNSRAEYDYRIQIPSNYYNSRKSNGATCQIIYSLNNQQSTLTTIADTDSCNNKECSLLINQHTEVKSTLWISATRKEQYYTWYRYCCRWKKGRCRQYCYDCRYSRTSYHTDTLSVEDKKDVLYYNHEPIVSFEVNKAPYDTYKGTIFRDNQTTVFLTIKDSYLYEYAYEYSAIFEKKPYYILTIEAEKQETVKQRNLLRENNTLYFKDRRFCSIEYADFFVHENKLCTFDLSKEPEIVEFQKQEFSTSWNLLFKIVIFIIINLIIYAIIKKTWGKKLLPFGMLFLMMPVAFAEECGLTNLASCIPEKIYDFFIDLLNAPLQPLLSMIRSLMETPPSITLFQEIWVIIVYCLSLFYGFLFIYSGFQFLISGHNALKREIAKEWLKNTVIMIILVQASYYLYELVLEVGAVLTSSVLSLVNEQFFLLTADNIVNMGLEFLFVTFYVIILFITLLNLLIRYILVAIGVVFAPIGIFCYFVPPLRSYGKLILNIIGTFIFITFFDAIIILGCSKLIDIPLFENIKIMVMISCFTLINTVFLILIIKATFKAVFSSGGGESITQAVKYVAMIV